MSENHQNGPASFQDLENEYAPKESFLSLDALASQTLK